MLKYQCVAVMCLLCKPLNHTQYPPPNKCHLRIKISWVLWTTKVCVCVIFSVFHFSSASHINYGKSSQAVCDFLSALHVMLYSKKCQVFAALFIVVFYKHSTQLLYFMKCLLLLIHPLLTYKFLCSVCLCILIVNFFVLFFNCRFQCCVHELAPWIECGTYLHWL